LLYRELKVSVVSGAYSSRKIKFSNVFFPLTFKLASNSPDDVIVQPQTHLRDDSWGERIEKWRERSKVQMVF